MPKHIVMQGEHLSRIADEAGFSDPFVIWKAPENAELRQARENPHVLMPGDEIFVPEPKSKYESGATEQKHRFRFHGTQLMLKLRLLGFDNQPLPDTDCELDVEGRVFELRTDGDGRIEQLIPKTAEDARLTFRDPQVPFDLTTELKIGYLDPVDAISGQKARLANLGYFYADDDGNDDERFNHAVQEFQCDFGLAVDGLCGRQTQAKLKEVHGC